MFFNIVVVFKYVESAPVETGQLVSGDLKEGESKFLNYGVIIKCIPLKLVEKGCYLLGLVLKFQIY